MSSPVVSPFPPLPWDVIGRILVLSSLPTQAVLARANYDFLVEVSPFIYKNTIVSSVGALCQLLLARLNEPSPRLLPHLSLSQVHHLTLDFASADSNDPNRLALASLSLSRLDLPLPASSLPHLLPLQSFSLSLPYSEIPLLGTLRFELFPLLTPIKATFHTLNRPSSSNAQPFASFYVSPLLPWSLLTHLSISGVIPLNHQRRNVNSLAGIPPSTLRNLTELRLDFETLRSTPSAGEASQLAQAASWAGEDVGVEEFALRLRSFGEEEEDTVMEGWKDMREGGVVVVVRTERVRKAMEKALSRGAEVGSKSIYRVSLEEKEEEV